MKASKALQKFSSANFVKNTFAQHFYKNAKVIQEGAQIVKMSYIIKPFLLGLNNSLSAGSMNTIIDAATTVHLVQKTLNKTISISLSGGYFKEIQMNDKELQIVTYIGKMGKDICFTKANGFVNKELLFSGDHIKKVLNSQWQF